MVRRFNTAGPCDPERHYMLPPAERLPQARSLVEQHACFVVHAPRQTGKTTTLRALTRTLTAEGQFAALLFSCETARVCGDDYGAAENIILAEMAQSAALSIPVEFAPPAPLPDAAAGLRIRSVLTAWAQACRRPLVLVFDEIDALRGATLESVLSQLRTGYNHVSSGFPASIILCGLRDIRDYKAASGGDPQRLGTSSPFNIKLESLRIGDFNQTELAIHRIWELSHGQPWLTNALARETVEKLGLDVMASIDEEHVDLAKEQLILARQTHLDSLAARLMEPRVRRVIEPLLAGGYAGGADTDDDDLRYCHDLGLIAPGAHLEVANPIYREVIARVLASTAAQQVPVDDPRAFVGSDGRLDFRVLLEEFAVFWRENGEVLAGRMPYHEVAPQLVLMAFLQRVVNGGGYIDREYGVGRGRIDLLVQWPHEVAGKRAWQREAIELKVWANGQSDPLPRGLQQLDAYLERLSLSTGVLVVFDRRDCARPVAGRTRFVTATTDSHRTVTVLHA